MGEYRTSSGDIGRGIAELDANRRAAKERAMADAAAAAAKETAERERRAAEAKPSPKAKREAEAAAMAQREAAAKPTAAPAPRLAPSADDTVRNARDAHHAGSLSDDGHPPHRNSIDLSHVATWRPTAER